MSVVQEEIFGTVPLVLKFDCGTVMGPEQLNYSARTKAVGATIWKRSDHD